YSSSYLALTEPPTPPTSTLSLHDALPIFPTWFGYSIGKWEGDTLVVDTVGFTDETWLDNGGHPHSDALHLTERFRRRNIGTLERSEEHTSELQSRFDLVCRLLLEKKNKTR